MYERYWLVSLSPFYCHSNKGTCPNIAWPSSSCHHHFVYSVLMKLSSCELELVIVNSHILYNISHWDTSWNGYIAHPFNTQLDHSGTITGNTCWHLSLISTEWLPYMCACWLCVLVHIGHDWAGDYDQWRPEGLPQRNGPSVSIIM